MAIAPISERLGFIQKCVERNDLGRIVLLEEEGGNSLQGSGGLVLGGEFSPQHQEAGFSGAFAGEDEEVTFAGYPAVGVQDRFFLTIKLEKNRICGR